MGVYGIADPITTNQKIAGSSPAERATKNPAKSGLFCLRLACHHAGEGDEGQFEQEVAEATDNAASDSSDSPDSASSDRKEARLGTWIRPIQASYEER